MEVASSSPHLPWMREFRATYLEDRLLSFQLVQKFTLQWIMYFSKLSLGESPKSRMVQDIFVIYLTLEIIGGLYGPLCHCLEFCHITSSRQTCK